MYSILKNDCSSYLKSKPRFARIVLAFLMIPGFRATALYRLGHRHSEKGHRFKAAVYTRLIRTTCHMDIEISAKIGPGVCFPHTWGIVIGGLCTIGKNCRIMQGVTIGGSAGWKKPDGRSQPIIGDHVVVAAGAKILGPVTVGDEAKIGANSVVISDVPAKVSVFGIPAKNIFAYNTDIEPLE